MFSVGTSIRIAVCGVVTLACLAASPTAQAAPFNYIMVAVGDPGNSADTTGYGAVPYSYGIGKYDVTIGQYAAFLNAVAATDTYSLYNPAMATDLNVAGISRAGSSGSFTYTVIGSPNRPATYVSWFDAARFANWMTNGRGSGGTETGAYTLVGGQTSGTAPAANAGASFRLPILNEWYKAAYFSPAINDGAGGYYLYATQSNAAPGNVIGSAANQANYKTADGYSVTQSPNYDGSQNYLTDVGAFSGSSSFYGTFDQSGNVFQWVDTTDRDLLGLRGGFWKMGLSDVSSSFNGSFPGSLGYGEMGFRLAGPLTAPVPEIDPSCFGSGLALVIGSLGLLERRRFR